MNTLYDLVTRIDALTANSQQVLNALIRSCVASGSSSGYTVKKYGDTITLNRDDIYRLYDFYQSWEAAGFPDKENEFASLLAAADNRWRTSTADDSTLATDAVVKHSKILYLGLDNKDNESVDYWVGKVRDSASGKAVISTAPIPLNLRTPLYDENLSVKSFSQYETYLFPMGYHRAEILGTPENGEDYIAGGKNWTIDASDFLMLDGKHITLGNVTNPQNRLDNYGTSTNTISWGNESYALKDTSLAFGDHSVAVAPRATVFGHECAGYGDTSFVAGGDGCFTVGTDSFASNAFTVAHGQDSFAANIDTYTGWFPYRFTFAVPDMDSMRTECDMQYIESEGVCVKTDITDSLGDAYWSVLNIPATAVNGTLLELPFKKGDRVVIYNLAYKDDRGNVVKPTDFDGYAAEKIGSTDEKVKDVRTVYQGEGDTVDHYEVVLEKAIPVENGKYAPYSGYVSLSSTKINPYKPDGSPDYTEKRSLALGWGGATFGVKTVSAGYGQTTVGTMNVPDYYARFIVGVGSYIVNDPTLSADHELEPFRSNGLLVSPLYSYMKLSDSSSVIGVAKTDLYRIDDMASGEQPRTMPRGAFLMSGDIESGQSTLYVREEEILARSQYNKQECARLGLSTAQNPIYGGGEVNRPVTAMVRSLQGTAVIGSGSYIVAGDEDSKDLIDSLLMESPVISEMSDPSNPSSAEHAIALYAEDGIDIRNIDKNELSKGINIETCSDLMLTFKQLKLRGTTYGALPTTDNVQSWWITGNNVQPDRDKPTSICSPLAIARSGFYYAEFHSSGNGIVAPEPYKGTNAHIIVSSVDYDPAGPQYNQAALLLPGTADAGVRPVLALSTTGPCGNHGVVPGAILSKELAYYEDVVNNGAFSTGPVSCYGYSSKADDCRTISADSSGGYYPFSAQYDNEYHDGYLVVRAVSDTIWNLEGYLNGNTESPVISIKNIIYSLNGNLSSFANRTTDSKSKSNIFALYSSSFVCKSPCAILFRITGKVKAKYS